MYAIKVVRLHISKDKFVNPLEEIYKHRVYRELQTASKITSDNIVRYFNSWFEELGQEELEEEREYRQSFLEHLNKKEETKNEILEES